MRRSASIGFIVAAGVLVAGLLIAFTVLASKLAGHRANVPPTVESVILQVRGPRVLAAALVGAALYLLREGKRLDEGPVDMVLQRAQLEAVFRHLRVAHYVETVGRQTNPNQPSDRTRFLIQSI